MFSLLLFFCLCRVFVFYNRSTLNFFCLNALWSEGAALSACEVRDVCCSDWTAFVWQGFIKITHIYENICRLHMKNFIRNARIMCEYWRRRRRVGRWRGSINEVKSPDQLDSSSSVLIKCCEIRGWDVGGVLGVQIKETGTNSKFSIAAVSSSSIDNVLHIQWANPGHQQKSMCDWM